ncbi:sensor histidine kinase [Falsiroseomonas sp.]|uniref:sensor histidine kinase n=1 Tax=Falsiroseomonas sp. TaxID=2870721 RepID=UPI00356AC029
MRLRLLLLVGLLTGGLFLLAGIATWQAHAAAQARVAEQMLGTVRALALLVDQEFARTEALLRGVAADPRLAEGDVEVFLAAARRLGGETAGLAMGMAEAPGRKIANSVHGRLAQSEPMPAGLAAVFTEGATTISNLFRSPSTGAPVVAVVHPVARREGGPPRFAIWIALQRDTLADALTRQHLPEGAIASVHDRDGTIVARSRRADEAVGLAPPAPLGEALATANGGIVERVTMLEGERGTIAFARAPVSGYAVAMALPEAVFVRTRNAALAWLAAFAAPVAGLGMVLALLLSLRLRQALASLSSGAAGPRLAEVEGLRDALAASDQARAESEAALRDRKTWLEQTQRAAVMGVWERDMVSDMLRWSDGCHRLFGLEPDGTGLVSRTTFAALVLEEDRWRLDAATAEAQRSGIYQAEFRIRRGDGAVRWIRAQGVLERGPDGAPRRILGANLDITERRTLEEERESLLSQKDLLVAEIHHRVKNSLQLVQGLLLLQARDAAPDLAARLRDAAARILSIAAVHRRLYEGGVGPVQDAAEHLAGLLEELRQSVASSGRQLVLEAVPGVRLPPERMAALGLLVTELVTNALKYGRGTVVLRLRLDGAPEGGPGDGPGGEQAVIEVEDQGEGFPDGFDPARSTGLGMRVALAMARQLRGELTIGPGACVVVRFPIRPPSPSHAGPAANK